eukprot:scaffold248223_cov38-Prasinocladus_malaysianus.AAC.3
MKLGRSVNKMRCQLLKQCQLKPEAFAEQRRRAGCGGEAAAAAATGCQSPPTVQFQQANK